MIARYITGMLAAGLLLAAVPSWGTTVPMNLLGMPLGTRIDNGIRVDIFVVQEAYPERNPPDAMTHQFTMMVSDGATGEPIPDASVSVVVLRPGSAEGRRTPAPYREPFYRAGARLPEIGEYTVAVECSAGGRSAKVSFPYRHLPAPAKHDHGKDPEPVIEGDSPRGGGGVPVTGGTP